jgi:hypothetical protein
MATVDTLEIIVKVKDLATGALNTVVSNVSAGAKKVSANLEHMKKGFDLNKMAMGALAIAGTKWLMDIAGSSSLASMVMDEFNSGLGMIGDTILITLMPVIQPLLDTMWAFADWFATADPLIQWAISLIVLLGVGLTVVLPIIGLIGPAFKNGWKIASDMAAYLKGDFVKDFKSTVGKWSDSLSGFFSSAKGWLSEHKVGLGMAITAAMSLGLAYAAFTSKGWEAKAMFAALTGVTIGLTVAQFALAIAGMSAAAALSFGVAAAIIGAAIIFGAAMIWGVQDQTNAKSATALASGGIVTSPTYALIGEAGPEAVIPLGRMGGGSISINYDLSGSKIGSPNEVGMTLEESGRRIADDLIRKGVVSRPY